MQNLKELLDDRGDLMVNWRSLYVDLVQGGIQDLFVMLNDRFLAMCTSTPHDNSKQEGVPEDSRKKVLASSGLVLLLARFSIYIEQFAVPKITEVFLRVQVF